MYEFITGKLISKTQDQAVLECAGIGYKLKTSFYTFEQLPLPGEEVKLYTYLHVREDIFELYGFTQPMEREFFFKLIAISKVGPKVALAILSGGSPDDIRNWVLAEDAKTIAKTPGIGATTAKRIILELKPKLEKGMDTGPVGDLTSGVGQDIESEALMALEAIGYARSEVYAKLRTIITEEGPDLSVEALIKKVLKK